MPAEPQQPSAAAADVDEDQPVPVPEPSEKAIRFYRSGNWLWVFDQIWGVLIPCLFLFTGFSARMRNWAQRLGRRWFFVIGIYFAIFTLVNFVIDFPIAYYQEFVRQHEYGLSTQTFEKWFSDSLKELAIGLIAGFLLLWVPYLLLRKSPRRWWLYTGLLMIPFFAFVLLIGPVWIDPLFNEFGPMKDKALEQKILAEAHRAGIEGGRVYEVNKSVDTKAVNAYVTGFLNSKRIVLWDTIIAKLNERELLLVMGHEMGHYVLGHVLMGMIFFPLLIMASLYAAHRSASGLIARYHARFGFTELSDVASLPLILLLMGIFTLLVTPLVFSFTRHNEHEADRFGLELTRYNHSAATAFVKMTEENLMVPRPGLLYKLWRSSHPLVGERIDFCNEYKPWKEGKPLKYEHLFKQ